MNPTDLITSLRQYIDELESAAQNAQEKLTSVKEEIRQSLDEKTTIDANLKTHKEQAEAEKQRIDDAITDLTKQNTTLKNENDELTKEKTNLKLENIALAKENHEFRQYEIAANKTLKATEQSLLAREKLLQEKESLRGNKFILPSRQ